MEVYLIAIIAVISFLVLLIFPIVVYCTYIIYIRNIKYGHIPRAPLKGFFKGHSPYFTLDDHEKKRNTYNEWFEAYGDSFGLCVLHRFILMTRDKNVIQTITLNPEYPKFAGAYNGINYLFGVRNAGNGILTTTNVESHKVRRAKLEVPFQHGGVQKMLKSFNEAADIMLRVINDMSTDKKTISLLEMMERASLDCIGKGFFNVDFEAYDEDSKFYSAVVQMFESVMVANANRLMPLNPKKRGLVKAMRGSATYLREFGRRVLKNRQLQTDRGEETPDDVLSYILKLTEVDETLTIEDMTDEFITILGGALGNIPCILAFTLAHIAQQPDVLERLVKEVDEVAGDEEELSLDDLEHCTYMKQVYLETIRMQPPGHASARMVPKDTELGGLRMPAGTIIAISFSSLNRDKKYFDRPHQFDPERFANGISEGSAFMPYSLGQRQCLSSFTGEIMYKLLLCKFLRNYNYTLTEKQTERVVQWVALRPASGVTAMVNRRSDDKQKE